MKEDFIKIIEDQIVCDDDTLEEEVMERLKDHLKNQSWEQLCDDGNAFINVLKYLMEEENIEISNIHLHAPRPS